MIRLVHQFLHKASLPRQRSSRRVQQWPQSIRPQFDKAKQCGHSRAQAIHE
ncbi:isochorismatase hydrolase [Alicyclobacillus hesperidum URH17-3-68]|nr:isochorismatase hydrolase [Alicyclobacillus hesperidum URH17-3-68]